ncbi:MAG: MerR family transcriptional regulator [Lachnospiraceae bacterium]
MKIKAVCENTGLTDRAVRFYIEKGLILPQSYELNGRTYYEYAEQDVEQLKGIMTLRKAGFSIEEILLMQKEPEKIDSILKQYSLRLHDKLEELQDTSHRLDTMLKTHPGQYSDMYDFARELHDTKLLAACSSFARAEEITPDFGRLDSETEEEKERMYNEFLGHQYVRDKREARLEKIKGFLPIRILGTVGRYFDIIVTGLVLLFVIALISVMIPRKVSSSLDLGETEDAFIHVYTEGWQQGNHTVESVLYMYDMEEYAHLRMVLSSYTYHGFVNSFFPVRSWEGKNAIVLYAGAEGGYDGGIMVFEDGSFQLKKGGSWYVYSLDWWGKEKAQKMYEELLEIVEVSYENSR